MPDGTGGYALAESVGAARALAGKVQGRRTSLALDHPVGVPPGRWDLTLQTTWVEPAYVEPDASWCAPGGEPASPVGNGGAFGGKLRSPVAADARRLADANGRPVRVLWSREDVVRHGPKRPPVAAGINADGSGVLRVGVPLDGLPGDGWARAVADGGGRWPPVWSSSRCPLYGPAVSSDLRAAVWAEAAVLAACARMAGSADGRTVVDVPVGVAGPAGGRATARCRADGSIEVVVEAGEVLDEVVLRSYCAGRRPPGPGLGGERGHRRGRGRGGPRPDHAVVRDPSGPGHAGGDRRRRGRRRPAPGQRLGRRLRGGGRRPLAGRRAPTPLAHRERAFPDRCRPIPLDPLSPPAPGKEEA